MRRQLPFARYLDVVQGIWIGKFIGGTLGAPIEGVKERHHFTADLVPAGIAENDDTDLQLLWLHALEEHGVKLTAAHLVAEWREHVRAPWNEYGVAAANWAYGVLPPESGRLNNWFWGECMGCPIRSEIWATICPGEPALAARYAAMDGSLDHYGEAVEAEKFFAAIEAALFFEKDLDALLDVGLNQIDPASRLAALIGEVRNWVKVCSWEEARARVLAAYGHPEMTHVLQNVGFVLIGLLCGAGDFGQTLSITLNCGYDADCTAGIAAAILGGIMGYAGIPEKFRSAVPADYRVSDWMHGFPSTGSIRELSLACCHFGRRVAASEQTGIEIGIPDAPPPAPLAVNIVALRDTGVIGNRFPIWSFSGPYWRNWEERREADQAGGEHGAAGLLSVHYFSHNQSGFDREFLLPAQLFSTAESRDAATWRQVRKAESDLLPLDHLDTIEGPLCYYASAEFELSESKALWLMVGTTGPVEVWLNGCSVLRSETYQPLTPTTFPLHVTAVGGRNQLVLKLARTSQPLGAHVAFKRHTGAHWHQSFYETALSWIDLTPAL